MPTYKTPNVYVEEIATLPPSVVPVATAIPAFIGCTEKAGDKNKYRDQPVRISSLLDYTTIFGGAQPTNFTVTLDESEQITEIVAGDGSAKIPEYLMYYMLRLFFDNGGGPCYVISIGDYGTQPDEAAFTSGLTALSKEDEPTLILLTDAVNLADSAKYYGLCQAVLKQCNALKDRFAIFDILASDDDSTAGIGDTFRNNIGNEYLKYGAAYYPYLQTSLSYYYTGESVGITGSAGTGTTQVTSTGEFQAELEDLVINYSGEADDNPQFKVTVTSRQTIAIDETSGVLNIRLPSDGATIEQILATSTGVGNYTLSLAPGGTATTEITAEVTETSLTPVAGSGGGTVTGTTLDSVKTEKTELYNRIKTALGTIRVTLPPSGAVAGVYAKVDRERGVWKAPANVSLASVLGPTVKVTNEEQERLNVDATAGKSINAIRSFTGKGTLIWGARTLAGNDNEWRYVPVRRLFNLIEESIQKATAFVVFESNNAVTWLKVKTIIESYLDGLWRQGALSGATQQEAFFVNVGLGQTMTELDILEGRMIIEVGISAVRPAEFIILRFSHKLQQA
ncbi:phage tail sheath family protein [Leptothoe spongobia]|uniref:Phage tail sheath family protein n=1 Tax=Leptothoe spongobia TAU-MAC 1115 TaxID=1967444 RepID=A0A947DCK9_9CYAN|nr:phage tail sheath C-terminal domain-containing protein [Leptothoe spongobia]MBT9314483.1 phage tail sheath family protein [Leptothoe spongobia TAU-MAC 1115]